MNRLENKVAIITGAAMGQGAAEAYLFAKEGAKVVATDMCEDILRETVQKINEDFSHWLCHNKQLINSHFYRGVSELPYKLLF
uniref:SDR family NAD(P)-dependent oxidoreductase n=1 Tax=Faecalibacillus faecis TaxID=1982628 RepID=UPI0018A89CDE